MLVIIIVQCTGKSLGNRVVRVCPAQVIYVVGVLKKRLQIPDECPKVLKQLICECWHDDPDVRPQFSAIVPRLEVGFPSLNAVIEHSASK